MFPLLASGKVFLAVPSQGTINACTLSMYLLTSSPLNSYQMSASVFSNKNVS
jgi:hypothetical protein